MAAVAPGCVVMACAHSLGLRVVLTAQEPSSSGLAGSSLRDNSPQAALQSRKRGRDGLQLDEASMQYPCEVSCLQALSLGTISDKKEYLVLVGHYRRSDDSGSRSGSDRPGTTLLLLSALGPHPGCVSRPAAAEAAGSSAIPTSGRIGCMVLSECSGLPLGFPASFEPSSGVTDMLAVPESVLFMDPSHSIQGEASMPERVRWLVGYRQGMLVLHQWQRRSDLSGSSEALWHLQLGDLPLTLSPLENGRSALVMGRQAHHISISPLNNRIVATNLNVGDVTSLSSVRLLTSGRVYHPEVRAGAL